MLCHSDEATKHTKPENAIEIEGARTGYRGALCNAGSVAQPFGHPTARYRLQDDLSFQSCTRAQQITLLISCSAAPILTSWLPKGPATNANHRMHSEILKLAVLGITGGKLGRPVCPIQAPRGKQEEALMTTFGELGPSAESYLKKLADVACSTGCVDRGVLLRIAKQYLSCALVRGRGIVFRHYYQSIAKCAGKDFRDGAAVPFE